MRRQGINVILMVLVIMLLGACGDSKTADNGEKKVGTNTSQSIAEANGSGDGQAKDDDQANDNDQTIGDGQAVEDDDKAKDPAASNDGVDVNGDEDKANAAGEDKGNGGAELSHELDDKRKAEPRQVPTQFPLPMLDGWVAGSPFEELTTGKKAGWSAEYYYNDAIEDNVMKYEQLLLEHGYRVEANALVEMSLGKGFIVTGHISGIFYSGSVVFDTNADGQNRVWMNFTEKKE